MSEVRMKEYQFDWPDTGAEGSGDAAFLMAEMADAPCRPFEGEGVSLRYAGMLLCEELGVAPQELPEILRESMVFAPNPSFIRSAREDRESGRFAPYSVFLHRDGRQAVRLRLSPRPVPGGVCSAVECVNLTEDRPLLAMGMTAWIFWRDTATVNFIYPFSSLLSPHRKSTFYHDSLLERIVPEYRGAFDTALKETAAGVRDSFSIEFQIEDEGPELRWVSLQGHTLRDPEGNPYGVAGVSMDITGRHEAEEKTLRSLARHAELLDRLPAFVHLQSQDMRIRYANRHFRDYFGECEGRYCHEVFHDRDHPCEECGVRDVIETNSLNIWEWDCPRAGMSIQSYCYPFSNEEGTPMAMMLGIDITQRKRFQEALMESQERWRSITDNISMGIMLIDRHQRVLTVNPRFREWFPQLDFDAGVLCTDVFPPEEGHCCCERLNSPEEMVEATYSMDLAGFDEPRLLRVMFCAVADLDGVRPSVAVIAEDVTERRHLEMQLERAGKLEAMGTLAGGIAHEINQPLNALELYLSGLEMLMEKDGGPDAETLTRRIRWMMDETSKIQDIVTHMRALVTEKGAGNAVPVDIPRCVEQALSLVRAQLRAHGVALSVDMPGSLPKGMANSVQLEQVVINLVINAMHALDETGGGSRRIVLGARDEGDHVVLFVQDNGPGIAGREARIFDPFYTTKDSGVGLGLGLSIVHTLVQSWGGVITAATNDEGGATFRVSLHCADE